jgi:hypothetical protein
MCAASTKVILGVTMRFTDEAAHFCEIPEPVSGGDPGAQP